MKSSYDVIVVGGGTSGSTMSKFLANAGVDVALFEKQKFSEIHKICGDATSEWHFTKITEINPKNKVDPPTGDEFYNAIKGFIFYSPTLESFKVPSDGDGWIIARERFGARLVREAGDSGVDLQEEVTVLKPLMNGEYSVVGLQVRDQEGQLKDIASKVVVDASGMAGVVRRQIDENKAKWDKLILHYDLAACHRDLVRFDEPIEDMDHIRLYFDAQTCPGGYFWIFPQNEYSANVGI